MNNISDFVGVNWYLGLPFAYPINTTGISDMTAIFEEVLGDRLIALQLGNEPDLYVKSIWFCLLSLLSFQILRNAGDER